MRFMGLLAIAAIGVASQASAPPANLATSPNPIVDGDRSLGPEACPWDLDGSGYVGIGDLLDLLAQWGTNPGGPPDFDGDGTVDITDFLALLSNWGACLCPLEVFFGPGGAGERNVVVVSTTVPTGPGSLHEALTRQTSPLDGQALNERLIVFTVGGTIDLTDSPLHNPTANHR